jgi:hypothetical protein
MKLKFFIFLFNIYINVKNDCVISSSKNKILSFSCSDIILTIVLSFFINNLSYTNITEINLSRLCIKEISSFVFIQNKYLQKLYINYNLIHAIHKDAFKGLNYLFVLDLSNYNIRELRPDILEPLTHINILYLQFNFILNIGDESIRYIKNLKSIFI